VDVRQLGERDRGAAVVRLGGGRLLEDRVHLPMSVSSGFRVAGVFSPFFDEPFVVFLRGLAALFVFLSPHVPGAHSAAVAGRAGGAFGHPAFSAHAASCAARRWRGVASGPASRAWSVRAHSGRVPRLSACGLPAGSLIMTVSYRAAATTATLVPLRGLIGRWDAPRAPGVCAAPRPDGRCPTA
jgi:hypothetical protein